MAEGDKILIRAIDNLKSHPFLVYSIAGLTALTASMYAPQDVSQKYTFLFYFVIAAPIVMQFYVELLKIRESREAREDNEFRGAAITSEYELSRKLKSIWIALADMAGGVIFMAVVLLALSYCSPKDDKVVQINEPNKSMQPTAGASAD